MCDGPVFGRGYNYRPADTHLDLLSVTHVHEAAAGWSENLVFGAEVRVVDVTRDEVSNHRRHSVYRRRVSNGVPDLHRGKNKHTLGIKEDRVFHKVWPFEHAP